MKLTKSILKKIIKEEFGDEGGAQHGIDELEEVHMGILNYAQNKMREAVEGGQDLETVIDATRDEVLNMVGDAFEEAADIIDWETI